MYIGISSVGQARLKKMLVRKEENQFVAQETQDSKHLILLLNFQRWMGTKRIEYNILIKATMRGSQE